MIVLTVDWLTKLGRKGFEALVNNIVEKAIDKALKDRVEPRLAGMENRLAAMESEIRSMKSAMESEIRSMKSAMESEIRGVRDRLIAIETRLDVADRLAKLEAEVAILKSSR